MLEYFTWYKNNPTKLKYKITALYDDEDGYLYVLEMWNDIRLSTFLGENLYHYRFKTRDDVIGLLNKVIGKFSKLNSPTADYRALLTLIKAGKVIPNRKKHR